MKIAKEFWLSVGLLSGTIIGAGVFSLPYIFKSAGITSGLFYLVLAAVAYIAVYFMYAEIISKTPGEHRFVGYTKIYLGKIVSFLAILMTIVQMILVLTIYLILSQSFGNLIIGFGAGFEKMVVFWFLGSVAIFLSLRRIAWIEFLITAGMIAIIILIAIFGFQNLENLNDVSFIPDWGKILLPLGPVLFALSGRVAIPAMLKFNAPIKKSIVWGMLIPVAVYGIFVLSVIALSPQISEDAVSGLIGSVPGWAVVVIGVFGILSLLSSYITVGFDVYRSLELDLRFPYWLQFLLIIFGPLAFYFAGFTNFIGLVSFVGGIFLALESIFIIWMWLKATGKRMSVPIFMLLLVFATALIYEILK